MPRGSNRAASFFAAMVRQGRDLRGICRFDEISASGKKTKKQKNEIFYQKPLTNGKKDDKIVNCIIIARIVGTLVFAAKCVIVKLHKRRMSKGPHNRW